MNTEKENQSTDQKFGTYIGVDLGDKKHFICVTDKDGVILKEYSITNHRDQLIKLCKQYPKACVAIEVGTHSPWISRLLSEKGMEVIVANPRKLRAIYQNSRKCDALDAQMLAKLVRVDASLLSPVTHGSERAQKDLITIKMRDTLVRQRVSIIASIRGVIKSVGLRLPTCSTASFHKKVRPMLDDHSEILSSITSALDCVEHLTGQIENYERQIKAAQERYPQAQRLQDIPGVGVITSLAFVLNIEDPNRFADPRDVGAYLGLVPRRDQSGDTDRQLPISKTGNSYLRKLLVQSSQYILGHHGPECALRTYGLKLAERGGKAAKKKAIVAVARKLAVTMMAMWQQETSYDPFPNSKDGGRRQAVDTLTNCVQQMVTC